MEYYCLVIYVVLYFYWENMQTPNSEEYLKLQFGFFLSRKETDMMKALV